MVGSPALRSPVTRLRRLTSAQERRLDWLRRVAALLDSSVPLPGTTFRFGLDPILGLVPGVGDLVAPLFTLGVIWQARDLGVPRVVLLRMILNAALDTLVGLVPVAGDLFDFAWKPNNRNVALLEQHAHEERPPSPGDWAFVATAIVLLVAIAAVPILLLGWTLNAVAAVLD